MKRVNSNCVNIMNTRNLSSQLDYTDTFNSGNIVKSPSHVIEMPTKNSIMSNLKVNKDVNKTTCKNLYKEELEAKE